MRTTVFPPPSHAATTLPRTRAGDRRRLPEGGGARTARIRSGRGDPVITNAFRVDPWMIHEAHVDLDALPQTESLFALANGHVGMRGNLNEGEPHAMPG